MGLLNEMNVLMLLIQITVATATLTPIVWAAGKSLGSKKKAKLIDAVWIVFLGTVIGAVDGDIANGFITAIIVVTVRLLLVKHFFDVGWLAAFVIAIVAAIVLAIILLAVALLPAILHPPVPA
jgi:hypothetical protein